MATKEVAGLLRSTRAEIDPSFLRFRGCSAI